MKAAIAVFILLAVGSVSAQACCGARSHKAVETIQPGTFDIPNAMYKWGIRRKV